MTNKKTNYYQKNKGFILPLILVFFIILFLIVQQEFEFFIIQKKLFFLLKERQKQFTLAQNQLIYIENNFKKNISSPKELFYSKSLYMGYINLENPKTWEKSPILKVEKHFLMQTIIAKILEVPCVEFDSNQNKGAIFYQIAIKIADDEQLHSLLLQAFWLQPSKTFICKEDTYTKVIAGEQSWEEL